MRNEKLGNFKIKSIRLLERELGEIYCTLLLFADNNEKYMQTIPRTQ